MSEREEKLIGGAVLGIATAAAFGNAYKPQRLSFPDSGRDRAAVHSIFDKIVCRYGKLSVVVASMMSKFYFDTGHHEMSRAGQGPICRRLQHLDQTCSKLSVDCVSPLGVCRTGVVIFAAHRPPLLRETFLETFRPRGDLAIDVLCARSALIRHSFLARGIASAAGFLLPAGRNDFVNWW
jgi:hypothetical protein